MASSGIEADVHGPWWKEGSAQNRPVSDAGARRRFGVAEMLLADRVNERVAKRNQAERLAGGVEENDGLAAAARRMNLAVVDLPNVIRKD